MQKFLSRKFILALAAQVIAVLALFVPEHSDTINSIVTDVAALVLSVGSALGYMVTDGKIDVASVEKAEKEVQ
jgi:hypothetical protein